MDGPFRQEQTKKNEADRRIIMPRIPRRLVSHGRISRHQDLVPLVGRGGGGGTLGTSPITDHLGPLQPAIHLHPLEACGGRGTGLEAEQVFFVWPQKFPGGDRAS